MKSYSLVVSYWDGTRYITDEENSIGTEFDGPVALCCGADPAQTQIAQQQSAAYTQMTQQASQVFGNSSAVFGDLMKTFAPTVAAGASQQGFSPAELSNLNSSAITQTGQAYRNAKSAVGEAQAAQGGGNVGDVSGGANVGTDLSVANSAASQTAGELNQIGEANYQTGRQNYDTAVQGLSNAPNVFNTATSMNNAATNSGNAAANTANQIAQENNSWVQAVTGALGSVAGAATTAGIGKIK
jgi:hypothetical protein